MNLAQVRGIIRALFYRMIYLKNIQGRLFTVESKSCFEVANKNANVQIGKFVYIRRNCRFRVDFSGKLRLAIMCLLMITVI